MALFQQFDDPLGGAGVTPTDALVPTLPDVPDLPIAPAMPAMAPPIAPAVPPLEQPQLGWPQALAMLIPALLAARLGPKSPVGQGLAGGLARGVPQMLNTQMQLARLKQQNQYQQALVQHRQAQETYQQAQMLARQDAEQRQRDALAQKALTTVGDQVGKFEDRESYDKYLERVGQTFAASGYPRLGAEQLRRMYPYRPPDSASQATKALKLYYEQPLIKRRLEKDGPTSLINDVITIGTGENAQRVSVLDAHKLAGQDLKINEQDQAIPLEQMQQWPAAVLSAKQQFFDDQKRMPTAADNPEVFKRARDLMQNQSDAAREVQGLRADLLRQQLAQGGTSGGMTAPSGGALTSDALDLAAARYRLTDKMPALGMGKDPDRKRILNRAAEQMRALGQSPAIVIQKQAAFKADGQALTQMRKMGSAAMAFENKANQQADLIDQLSGQVTRSQIPLLNQAIVSGKINLLGDSSAAQLANAIITFGAEYAKIMEGSTGSVAASTDSSRKAVERLINTRYNAKQLHDVLDLMRREMRFTLQGYDAVINDITERMGGQAPGADVTAAPPTERYVRDPKTGKLVKAGG